MISTHVLDLSSGAPASGIEVILEKDVAGKWTPLQQTRTNSDGRISFSCPPEPGTYRLSFRIDEYLRQKGQTPFFLTAPLVFEITDAKRKYHVPLLLSPYGYSTYRGS